ncbi:MAG: endonuclease/exonuclease/phosphatase family protein [Ignavibacteria bacterium]|nr:endonuclease/exonuclease/phosphatase family protein [Ignavibacteria bacterium]
MNIRSLLLATVVVCTATALHAQDPISIADAKKQEFGTAVTKIAGRVSSSVELSNVAYIQDKTGGIAIFNENMRTAVRVGDSVMIESGNLAEFGNTVGAPGTGLTQLDGKDLRFTVIPTARIEPAPRNLSIPLIGEGVEGQLVKIRRLRFVETGKFQANTSFNAIDNSGNDIVVRIDRACEIGTNSLDIPTEEVDVTGVISQFRGSYQILPRVASDIGAPPIEIDTVQKDRTLDLTTWNLEWFGWPDSTRGPDNKDLQRTRIRQVMDSIKADIYALQEIVTDEALASLSDSIQGSYARFFATDITSEQKLAYIYNTATITPVSTGLAVNGGAQAWANGRYPYRMTFDARIGSSTKRIVVFDLHAKATDSATAMVDYERRKTDAETFHTYLQDFYPDSNVIVMGDFNDRLLATNVDEALPSCYLSFVNDTQNWLATTAPLEEAGLSSYVGFNRSFIDHILVSNELADEHYRTYLEAPERFMPSYSSTVSDHRPVTVRLAIDGAVSVDESETPVSTVRVSPNPMSASGMAEITALYGGMLRVDLVSATGEQLALVNESVAPSVRVLVLPVSQLTSGTYRLVVTLNGVVSSTPVMVIR